MSGRPSKPRRQRRHREFPQYPVDIRVGSRRSQEQRQYLYLRATSVNDAGRFEGLIDHVVQRNPGDPILLVCTGFQPWLETLFQSCLRELDSGRAELNRETHYADTLRFPMSSHRPFQKKMWLPWTFIVDQINLPDVYYWTFGEEPPEQDSSNESPNETPIDFYRFRMGVWTCAQGAYIRNENISVTMIFLQYNTVSELFATELFFGAIYKGDYIVPRTDEASVAYIFRRLFRIATDWQNVIREFEGLLGAAEESSRGGKYPVKDRTRAMHTQIGRIYELLLYLRFQTFCFKKLARLKPSKDDKGSNTSQAALSQKPEDVYGDEVIWDEIVDEMENLEQENYELDQLKERFDNLTNLEFNIENAKQSASSRFLAIIATLFLPLSYLASIWGITTFTASPIEYLYTAIPVLVVSVILVVSFRHVAPRIEKFYYYRSGDDRVVFRPQSFSMLNEELPDALDVPGAVGRSRLRRGNSKHESRRRSRSAHSEKDV